MSPTGPVRALLRRREPKVALRALVRVLRLVTPTRPHVVVTGFPDTEGNAVEVIRRLLQEPGQRVDWLTGSLGTDQAARALAMTPPPGRLRVLPKRSARGFATYLTARTTFVTHGLYLSPEPPRRKPVVNLWHGDGPKAGLRDRANLPPRATVIVSGARVFGERKADFLDVPPERLLVTGNPRWDQLRRPATDDELRALGLEPDRPLVLYMPTFRSSVAVGARAGWSDTTGTSAYSSRDMLAGLVRGAESTGAQVVVKPHPLDADHYDVVGARCVTNAQLDAADVLLYRLLGRAAALVTDSSSVWTDFLVLDRPLGFALNDLEDYAGGSRGLNVDNLGDLLPGPQLLTPEQCAAFVPDAVKDVPALAELRARSVARIGLAPAEGSATDRLLGELTRRGLLRLGG
ncbi:CDP-glycerol glycerophosphotransferase family protein [Nocardioides sp.]|uniref:CDP-glycerol glycerophosphotransferase family protein n=1 Tax=Nocardioides sp. TaxID=35761 RepID=UPI001A18D44B|nr:CDP-glycerol glycerophosphotransferase family protein [Nocardioides sp.]MBJ7357701.1 CDP-glycerol glycerophosphotransferase family protein [Nocardioides sp.]